MADKKLWEEPLNLAETLLDAEPADPPESVYPGHMLIDQPSLAPTMVDEYGPDAFAPFNETGAGPLTDQPFFRGFPVITHLSSKGMEADIYLLGSQTEKFVLRLYRQQRNPKRAVFDQLPSLTAELKGHLVRIYEAGFDQATGRWYEFQEFISHGSLADLMKKEPFSRKNFLSLIRQLAATLKAFQNKRLIHRDIKPENILVKHLDPLTVVLTDFGISSELSGDLSLKETKKAHTPFYAPPESYTGIIGKAGDWWSLGVIFLEILTGGNPLTGFSLNQVMYEVVTRGIKIPENLPEADSQLLKGLLTRNPKKRWGANEVGGWLDGVADIPVFFEEPVENQNEADRRIKIPFRFEGHDYYSLNSLAKTFARNETSWREGASHLARGRVGRWCENNSLFEEAQSLETEMGSADECLLAFIRKYDPESPLIYGGRALTLNNLAGFFSGAGQVDETCASLVRDLAEGRGAILLELLKTHNCQIENDTAYFLSLVPSGVDLNEKQAFLFEILAAALRPEDFQWGPTGPPATVLERLQFASMARPLTKSRWAEIIGFNWLWPQELALSLNAAETYLAAVKRFYGLGQKRNLLDETMLTQATGRRTQTGVQLIENLKITRLTLGEYAKMVNEIHYGHYLKRLGPMIKSLKNLEKSLPDFGESEIFRRSLVNLRRYLENLAANPAAEWNSQHVKLIEDILSQLEPLEQSGKRWRPVRHLKLSLIAACYLLGPAVAIYLYWRGGDLWDFFKLGSVALVVFTTLFFMKGGKSFFGRFLTALTGFTVLIVLSHYL